MSQLHPVDVHSVATEITHYEITAALEYYSSIDLVAKGALVYFLCWTIQTLDFLSFMRYSTIANGTMNSSTSSTHITHPSAPVSLEARTDTADGSGLLDWGASRPYDEKFIA